MTFCPLQILHGATWDRIWVCVERGRRLRLSPSTAYELLLVSSTASAFPTSQIAQSVSVIKIVWLFCYCCSQKYKSLLCESYEIHKYTVRHNAEYLIDTAGCASVLNYHCTFIVVCWQLRKTAFKVRVTEINEHVLEMPLFYVRKYDLIRGRNFYMCNWGLRSVLKLVSNHSSSEMRLMSDEAKSYMRHWVTM